MATLVTVLRSGGRYDAVWVERLARGVRRFAPAFDRIVCLTDMPLAVPGVDRLSLRHGWPGWWSKMEAFRPGLATGTIVLCDLDTVFAGQADALAEPGLTAMEDFFHEGRLSSALLRWHADALAFVYDTFAAEPQRWMAPGSCGPVPNAVHGDQVVIDHLLRAHGLTPALFQRRHAGLIDFYEPSRPKCGPVVIFIGESKPDRAIGPAHAAWIGSDRIETGAQTRSA